MDSKLKCVFEMPVENNETAGDSAMEDTLIVQEKLKKSQVKPSFKVILYFFILQLKYVKIKIWLRLFQHLNILSASL